jgi:hypothetical protein
MRWKTGRRSENVADRRVRYLFGRDALIRSGSRKSTRQRWREHFHDEIRTAPHPATVGLAFERIGQLPVNLADHILMIERLPFKPRPRQGSLMHKMSISLENTRVALDAV